MSKPIISIKNLWVKFCVRGKIMSAIRNVSFDIYKGEKIAIVGESGSGKSVFTKAINNMLEDNGYIADGTIHLNFDQDQYLDGLNLAKASQNSLNNYNRSKIGHAIRKMIKTNKQKLKKITSLIEWKKIKNELALIKIQAKINNLNQTLATTLDLLNKKISILNNEMKTNISSNSQDKQTRGQKESSQNYIKTLQKKYETYKLKIEKQIKQLLIKEKNINSNFSQIDKFYADKAKELDNKYEALRKKILVKFKNNQSKCQHKIEWLEYRLTTKKAKFTKISGFVSLKNKIERFKTLHFNYNESLKEYATSLRLQKKVLSLEYKIKELEPFFISINKEEGRLNIINDSKEEIKTYINDYFLIKREWYLSLFNSFNSLANCFKKRHFQKRFFNFSNQKLFNYIRGKYISTIFQDPSTSLNPLLSVGYQIAEIIHVHNKISWKKAKQQAIELLAKVGINEPAKRIKDIPSSYSGGMRQRVVIAMAIAANPKILIADEPTTALDVTVQAQILELLKKLCIEYQLTLIFITHDLGVVANIADRVAIMYAGQIIEYGSVDDIFYNAAHPYTWALLGSLPQISLTSKNLSYISGSPPSLLSKIKGDAFALRSQYALKIDFEKEPPFFALSSTHYVKSWLADKRASKIFKQPAYIKNIHQIVSKARIDNHE